MEKIVILDTNVLLHDPGSINNYPKSHVIIPIGVIEQADRFKRDMAELGKNAREINRMLDSFRHKGSLTEGIVLDNGSKFQIMLNPPSLKAEVQKQIGHHKDHGILAIALGLKEQYPDKEITLVTKDLNLRVKADALGISAEGYEKDRFEEAMTYKGVFELTVSTEQLEEFNSLGSLTLENKKFRPNEFITLKRRRRR